MKSTARFQVDPRLASLLGQAYRSSEEALRELVDNAWDADADRVTVRLPDLLDASPIVVEDNGSGMTELEVREEYLRIASDRRTRKGDRSTTKHRRIRGRKGIGKFAGLMAADEMKVETWARGTMTTVVITKAVGCGSIAARKIDVLSRG
jgi:HSP90 family molecular chaperone